MPKPKTLSQAAVLHDRPLRTRIGSEAGCDERAVRRAYEGHPTAPATYAAVAAAARRLHLPPPPPHAALHRRAHSADASIRCEICAPLMCERAS